MEPADKVNRIQFGLSPGERELRPSGLNSILEEQEGEPETHWRAVRERIVEKDSQVPGEELEQWRKGLRRAGCQHQEQVGVGREQPHLPREPLAALPATRTVLAETDPGPAPVNLEKDKDDLAALQVLQLKREDFRAAVQDLKPGDSEV